MITAAPPITANPGNDLPDLASTTVEPYPWSLSVRYENDIFGGTDRFYTDGVSISLIHSGPEWLEKLADRLPWSPARHSLGFDFGQLMVTPADKSLVVPDPKDRPYAGILFVGVALHVNANNRYHGFKFVTGVVGPWSLAGETQREVHRWVGSEQALGWDSQLHNEPLLNLVYEHRRKYSLLGSSRGWSAEAIPTVTAMAGNLLTQAQIGGQLRVGWNLPNDVGVTLMRGMGHLPPPIPTPLTEAPVRLGVLAYGGLHGNLVLHNLTLDGNTWTDSPSVEKNLLVPAGELGFGVVTPRILAAFSYVIFGREFKDQVSNSKFGALTVTYRF